MNKRRLFCIFSGLVLASAMIMAQTIPAPEAFFGHRIGAEKSWRAGTRSSST